MKILQVTPYFYPAWAYGGPARIVYELSKQLVKKGHQVTVFTTDAYTPKERIQKVGSSPYDINGIGTFYFKNISNLIAWRFKIFLSPGLFLKLAKTIKQFDIIHAHEYFSLQSFFVALLAKKNKIPYVLSAHGSLDPGRLKRKSVFKRIYYFLMGKVILKNAKKLVASAEAGSLQYQGFKIPESKIVIIPNGVDFKKFPLKDEKVLSNQFKKKYNLQGKRIILYLGRIHQIKGIDLLVNAFSDLILKLEDIHLVIVGPDDGYLPELKEKVKQRKITLKTTILDFLDDKEKLEAFAAADVFALPSVSEGFSLTVVEAAMTGTPVVITKGCHVPEVERYEAGIIIPREEKQLERAIFKILTNQKLQRTFGKNARKMVREKFTWEKVAEQTEALYKEVLRN